MTKEEIISFIDKSAFLFFLNLVIFIPVSNAVVESSFGFIFLCFILRVILKRPTRQDVKAFFKNRINLSLLIFYIIIGLSLCVSGPLFKKSLNAWFSKWGEGVLLFYFAQIFLRKENVKFLLIIIAISAFFICIDGIYQKITGVDFIRGFPLVRLPELFLPITATFKHYNDFASFLIVIFFINYGIWGYLKKFWSGLVFLLGFLIITNLFFTYSRGGWFSFLVVCIFLIIFFTDKKGKIFLLSFLLIFTGVILSTPSLRERFLFIIKNGGDSQRLELWKASIFMFKDSPLLGKGLGLFMDYIPKYAKLDPRYAHNCYLQILAETGILGLTSFLWFLGEVIFRSYKKLMENFDNLFLGLFFGSLAFLIHSFFDTQLFSLRLSILFWLLASFISIYLTSDEYSKGNT